VAISHCFICINHIIKYRAPSVDQADLGVT